MWSIVWRKICVDLFCKFLVFNMLIFGGIFSWLEEPGYMLFVVSIIGLQWQTYRKRLEADLVDYDADRLESLDMDIIYENFDRP
jgi:hypothetical protein